MNEAAILATDALLGEDFKTIILGGKGYSLKPPTIKVMCMGLREWAKIDFQIKNQTNISLVSQIPDMVEHQLRGISYFIAGNRSEANRIYNSCMRRNPGVTQEELNIAINTIIGLIDKESVFQSAQECLSAAKIIARPK